MTHRKCIRNKRIFEFYLSNPSKKVEEKITKRSQSLLHKSIRIKVLNQSLEYVIGEKYYYEAKGLY